MIRDFYIENLKRFTEEAKRIKHRNYMREGGD